MDLKLTRRFEANAPPLLLAAPGREPPHDPGLLLA